MSTTYILYFIGTFLVGFAAGFWIAGYFIKSEKRERFGTIHVETSDPDGPYIFLELDRMHPPAKLVGGEEVTFLVDTHNYIPPQD